MQNGDVRKERSTLPKSRKRDDFRFKSRGMGMSRVSSGKQNNPPIGSYFRFRIYTHVTGSQSLIMQENICLRSTLSNSLSVWMYLFVCYVYITCACIFVYICYPLLERVY